MSWRLVVAAVALVVATGVMLLVTPPDVALAIDNLVQFVAPVVAAAGCADAAWRADGRGRHVWTAMAAGCASWAVGQGIWTVYEVGLGRETPFPSIADLGFLGFPIGAGAALWLYPSSGAADDRNRRVLDGLTITSALGLVSWTTALRPVAEAGADNQLALVIGLAYPASALVIMVMALLVLGNSDAHRPALWLIAAGVGSIAVADTVFAFLTAHGTYGPGGLEGLGWIGGFLLLGLASRTGPIASRDAEVGDDPPVAATGVRPYVPVLVAIGVVTTMLLTAQRIDRVVVVLGVIVLTLVLARQYTTLRDNGRLVLALAQREAELRHQAFHDGLTGLANRALFQDRVQHALMLHQRDQRPLAVLFCDLDDFKVINDTMGHVTGDDLLVRVSERLRGALRAGDTLARLGGDEFAVLLEDTKSPDDAASAILGALAEPFVIDGVRVSVSTSIGLTTVTTEHPSPTASALLIQADTAMYAAKRSGRGVVTFARGMTLPEVARYEHRDALAGAIASRRIGVVYQPIVDLDAGRAWGVEALARWQHGDDNVPPTVFVDVAERTGLIADLTDLVLETVCAQLDTLTPIGTSPPLSLAVNISPHQITDRAFPAHVHRVLDRHGMDPSRLVMEITESGLLADMDAAERVTADLADLGIRIAMDDVGIGYSSLAHLDRITLHQLKIDRSFVAVLGQGDRPARVATALLSVGRTLGLDVVAEGVERPDQLTMLRDLGCRLAQGFLLGRPAPAEAIAQALADPPPTYPDGPVQPDVPARSGGPADPDPTRSGTEGLLG